MNSCVHLRFWFCEWINIEDLEIFLYESGIKCFPKHAVLLRAVTVLSFPTSKCCWCQNWYSCSRLRFSWGAFAKLRKATISFAMSVCLSVRPSFCLRGPTWLQVNGFSWRSIFEYFSKMCLENSCLIKCDKNDGYLTWRPIYRYDSILPKLSEYHPLGITLKMQYLIPL